MGLSALLLLNPTGLKWTFAPQQTFSAEKQKDYLTLLGLSGLEPPTSRLSGVRSNRLSYKPFFLIPVQYGFVHLTFVR